MTIWFSRGLPLTIFWDSYWKGGRVQCISVYACMYIFKYIYIYIYICRKLCDVEDRQAQSFGESPMKWKKHQMSHKKPLTFHWNPDCYIRILIMVYYNSHISPNNKGPLFIAQMSSFNLKLSIRMDFSVPLPRKMSRLLMAHLRPWWTKWSLTRAADRSVRHQTFQNFAALPPTKLFFFLAGN